MDNITLANLQSAILLIIGIAGILVSIDKGIEVIQKWRGTKARKAAEKATDERFIKLEERLQACEDRLERGDQKFSYIEEDSKHTLMALNAMLMHFISGNDHEKLKSVKSELDKYMSERR